MSDVFAAGNGKRKPGLVLPTGAEAAAALKGNLSDRGTVRGAAPAAVLRDWSTADARAALKLPAQPTAWVTSAVGDPDVFAENERRKIWAVIGDLSGIAELIWNRTILAVWRAPSEKDLGGGKRFYRSEQQADEDSWRGHIAMVLRMGPTAFVSGKDEETGESIYFPQAPKVGDWVVFSRGYGMTLKINDYPCILLDKETEAVKMVLRFPHAVDIT